MKPSRILEEKDLVDFNLFVESIAPPVQHTTFIPIHRYYGKTSFADSLIQNKSQGLDVLDISILFIPWQITNWLLTNDASLGLC